jgi:hypothetical protein
VIKKLNPPQRFPADPTPRLPRPAAPGRRGRTGPHPDEYYLLILNIDMGAQFYFRENKGGI